MQEAASAKAERLVLAGLKRLGWDEGTLKQKRTVDPGKVASASELRAGTTMSLGWITGRLGMGSRGYLAWLLGRPNPSARAQSNAQGLL